MTALWRAILIGLGVAKLVQMVKEMIPWPLQGIVKSGLAVTATTVLSAALSDDPRAPRTWIPIALGAAGISGISHEVQDFLAMQGDRAKMEVMIRGITKNRA